MTEIEFREFVERQKFRKATTAKRNPHEYIVQYKNVVGTNEEFLEAIQFILDNGFELFLWGRKYTVYCLKGRFYWGTGLKTDEIILNRNDLNNYEVKITPKEEFLK